MILKEFLTVLMLKLMGLSGKIIKACNESSFIFTYIFYMSLKLHIILHIWKSSEIIPVHKKYGFKIMNNLQSVVLTSITMKCLQRLVLSVLYEEDDCLF